MEARVVAEVARSKARSAQRRPYRYGPPVRVETIGGELGDDEWQRQREPQHLDQDRRAQAPDAYRD